MKTVNVGDEVKVIFNGIGKNKKDEDMKLFSVFKKKDTEQIGEGEIPSSSGGGEDQEDSDSAA